MPLTLSLGLNSSFNFNKLKLIVMTRNVLPKFGTNFACLFIREKGLRYFMPEIVLGDLAQIKLLDILNPLFSAKKTGRIMVKGKEGGELYLEFGNITHAKTNNAVGESAFFTLMGLSVGKALFEPDEVPSQRTIATSTGQLMLNWYSQKQEWDKIKEVVPSPDALFRFSPQKSPENKNINADQWNVLTLCNGTKAVSDIAEALNRDEFKTSMIIFELVQLGLLVRAEAPKPVKKRLAGENFFLTIEKELNNAIGPIAPIIIDSKLVELGETRSSFSQDKALSLIQALSEEIPQDQARKEFSKAVVELLYSGK